MKQTTLQSIIPHIESVTGIKVDKNRPLLLRKVNEAIHFLWSLEPSREAYFRRSGCVQARTFYEFCRSSCACSKHWVGVSLDQNINQIDELRVDGARIKLEAEDSRGTMESTYSNREGYDAAAISRNAYNSCCQCDCIIGMDMGTFPLPFDLAFPQRLKFFANHIDDIGKKVHIRYADANGTPVEEFIELSGEGTESSRDVMALDKQAITLPADRCGWVSIRSTCGDETSYHPSVDVVDHRRYAIQGVQPGAFIEWSGIISPGEVFYDSDPVPTGNIVLWKTLINALSLVYKTDKTNSEVRAEQSAMEILSSIPTQELQAQQGYIMPNLKPHGFGMMERTIRRVQSRRGTHYRNFNRWR